MCYGPYGGEQQSGAYECCAGADATGSVYAFIDGKRVDSGLLGVPPQHDLTGTRYLGCSMIMAADGSQSPDPTCQPTCGETDSTCDPELVKQIGGPEAASVCSQLCTGAEVRARPGRLSALSVFHSKTIFYGGFVWARRALDS
jgi:hypothetical protein